MFVLDMRHAVRLFSTNRGFTVLAVLTLALGIGVTTAIFSVVDAVLLRPAPLPEWSRLAVVWETDRQSGTTREPGSFPDFLDYRERTRTIESLSAFQAAEVTFTPAQGEPQRLQAIVASESFLPMLGIAPVAGRHFSTSEVQPGGPPSAIVSVSLASRLFPDARDVVGRTLRVDGRVSTIVGVMPDGSDFGV